jgi:hypothetical protein
MYTMKHACWTIIYLFIFTVICSSFAPESRPQTLPLERCDTSEHELLKDDQGRTVWLIEEACGGFLNGGDFAIALSQRDGKRKTFFHFDDASWDADYNGETTPSVRWVARDHLEVSIGAVASIIKKLDKVDGVTITYKIGHVLSK